MYSLEASVSRRFFQFTHNIIYIYITYWNLSKLGNVASRRVHCNSTVAPRVGVWQREPTAQSTRQFADARCRAPITTKARTALRSLSPGHALSCALLPDACNEHVALAPTIAQGTCARPRSGPTQQSTRSIDQYSTLATNKTVLLTWEKN